MSTKEKVVRTVLEAGQLLRLELHAPKGNVLDGEMIASLDTALVSASREPGLKAVLFCGAGDHFSFGASVPEHRKEQAPGMLAAFHGMIRRLCTLNIPSFACIRGSCLGGGLELASACSLLLASPDAKLGQPEIKLAVIAPLGSVLLPWRIGGRAVDLLISGRTITAQEAKEMGLLLEVTTDPEGAALEYMRKHLWNSSASSLRFAEEAARRPLVKALSEDLKQIEQMYVERLMETPDANEGIEAFLAKRPPRYQQTGQKEGA
jgi:cyclohexa-1,5-dienecarbonyl-CoA hydratase